MARGARHGPSILPADMGGNKVQNLGRSVLATEPNGAARLDDIPLISTRIPLPVGGSGDPGHDGEVSDSGHQHPGQSAAVEGAFLYTVRLPDPLVRLPVRALCAASGGGYGLTLDYGWTQLPGAFTWLYNLSYPLKAYVDGVGGDFAFDVGDRFYAANDGGSQSKYSGIYEVLSQANGSSGQTIIRRTSDANTPAALCAGMAVQITGSGVYHSGDYVVLDNTATVVDDTALTFTIGSYSEAYTYDLLTSAQLATEQAPTDTCLSHAVGITSSEPAGVDMTPDFGTLPGTPGLDVIPAGPFSVRVKYRRHSDADDTTQFELQLFQKHVGVAKEAAPFLSLWSPPLHDVVDTVIEWQGILAAALNVIPSDEIVATMRLHSDSADGVDVYWTWQNVERSTRVGTTWQNPVSGGGTNWHPDQLGRDQPNQHPADAIGPGRLHRNMGVATFDTHLVTMPDDANQAEVTVGVSLTIDGICKTGWTHGDSIALFVTNGTPANPVRLFSDTDMAAHPTFAPMMLESIAGTPASPMNLKGPTWCRFWYDGTADLWRQDGEFTTYVVPT
jgi:hypothetical protein